MIKNKETMKILILAVLGVITAGKTNLSVSN